MARRGKVYVSWRGKIGQTWECTVGIGARLYFMKKLHVANIVNVNSFFQHHN